VQRLIAAFAFAAVLAGCATAPPAAPDLQLRLAPALLGRELDLQQHLTMQAPGREQQMDVLLEADATHVQLAMLVMGQVAGRLSWDGQSLVESRAPWWPKEVPASRILSDLQLTLWPVSAIQAALPPGWRLVEEGGVRTLTREGRVVTVVTRRSPSVIELDERDVPFKLTIESREAGKP